MTQTSQLRRSGNRLQRQSMLWLHQTKGAGQTFLVESRDASAMFARNLQRATGKLATTVSRSTGGLQTALRREALDWQRLVIKTRTAYAAALRDRIDRTASAIKQAPTKLVARAGAPKTGAAKAKTAKARTTKAKTTRPKTTKTKARTKPATARGVKPSTAEAPLRDYDQLTAKDVVSRIQRLSGPQAAAVLEYERARKKRTTVIRAAEQRRASAS